MVNTTPKLTKFLFTFLILISILTKQVVSVKECGVEAKDSCNNKEKAFPLKLIAISSILASSIIGVSFPLATRSIPALSPDKSLFVIVKAFASGIILATGFMHVLPDSFDMLSSECLKENPWHKFPFTGFVAMLSAIFTLMVDSITTSLYTKKKTEGVLPDSDCEGHGHTQGHGHHHGPIDVKDLGVEGENLLRYRVIAMVLELGIIVHSVVIGFSLGASNNTCTVKGLIAALSHSVVIGNGTWWLHTSNLLAADFMGPKLQGSIKLQIKSYMGVLLGVGGMSLMAKWA